MSEEILDNNNEAENMFHTFQYLSMLMMKNLVSIHSALPDGDIESARKNIDEIREICNSLDNVVDAMEDIFENSEDNDENLEDNNENSEDDEDEVDGDLSDIEDIESEKEYAKYLNEDKL